MLTLAAAVVAVVLLAAGCINGGTWSATAVPVTPTPGTETRLHDVSCLSEDWCLAVGFAGVSSLAEVWDGSGWSVVATPVLGAQRGVNPVRVVCGTPTSCVAAVTRPLPWLGTANHVIAWDGTGWHQGSGAEGSDVDPFPFDCAADASCLIVDEPNHQTLIWDGHSFGTVPFSLTGPPAPVTAIECTGVNSCLAATTDSLASWGVGWSAVPGSDYSTIFAGGASSLACSASFNCLAVGPDAGGSGPTSATWDGSVWTEVALPAGVTGVESLDCVGPNECLLPVSGLGTGGTLAWMAGGWHQATPAPAGIGRMSCLPRWCLGVGFSGSPASPTAATYAWTND